MTEAVVLMALVAGLAVGTYYVAQAPSFWVGLVVHVAKEISPVFTRRKPKNLEDQWRECMLKGGKWNDRKQRCE